MNIFSERHAGAMQLTNPNNPVGTILTEAEMDGIIEAAARVGAWILADEVYRGTERLTDAVTPSFHGRCSQSSHHSKSALPVSVHDCLLHQHGRVMQRAGVASHV